MSLTEGTKEGWWIITWSPAHLAIYEILPYLYVTYIVLRDAWLSGLNSGLCLRSCEEVVIHAGDQTGSEAAFMPPTRLSVTVIHALCKYLIYPLVL